MLDTQNSPLPHITETPNHILSTINATEKDVIGIWKSLYVNKSTGPDEISAKMLREASTAVAKSLTWLINVLLNKIIFPDEWKLVFYRLIKRMTKLQWITIGQCRCWVVLVKLWNVSLLNTRLIIFEIKVSYLLFSQGLLLATPLRTSCCTFITCYAKLSTTKKKLVFRDISKALIKDSKIQTSFIPQKYKYLYIHNYHGHLAKHVLEWQYNIIWRLSLGH